MRGGVQRRGAVSASQIAKGLTAFGIVCLVGTAVGVVLTLRADREANVERVAKMAAEAQRARERPDPPREQIPDALRPSSKSMTAREAVEKFNPATRTNDTVDAGLFSFISWAGRNMRWDDAFSSPAETSLQQFEKDPDAERGKRVCQPGTVIRIEKEMVAGAPIFSGELVRDDGRFVSFVAVRDTGPIVTGSAAKFCGVALAVHVYTMLQGGQTRSLRMVGMFDLPSNRAEKK